MKKWLSLLLALGMLLGLTACGRKDGAPEADPPAAVQPEEPAAPADPPAGEPDEKGEEPVLPPQVPEEENAEDGEPQEDAEPEVWRAMVSHEDVTLFSAGEAFRLTVWDVNGNAPDACTYTSDDPAVAAVDETGGQVTAVGPGVTNVTVLAEYGGDEVSFSCIVRCGWKEEEPALPDGGGETAELPALADFFATLQGSYEGLGAMMVIDGELLDNYYPGLSGIAAVEEVLMQETRMSMANAAVGLVRLSEDAVFDDFVAVMDAMNARITAQADGGAWYPASCETWEQGVVTSVSGYVGMFVYPEEAQAMADLFTQTYSN